jgi:hypothetical protein
MVTTRKQNYVEAKPSEKALASKASEMTGASEDEDEYTKGGCDVAPFQCKKLICSMCHPSNRGEASQEWKGTWLETREASALQLESESH